MKIVLAIAVVVCACACREPSLESDWIKVSNIDWRPPDWEREFWFISDSILVSTGLTGYAKYNLKSGQSHEFSVDTTIFNPSSLRFLSQAGFALLSIGTGEQIHTISSARSWPWDVQENSPTEFYTIQHENVSEVFSSVSYVPALFYNQWKRHYEGWPFEQQYELFCNPTTGSVFQVFPHCVKQLHDGHSTTFQSLCLLATHNYPPASRVQCIVTDNTQTIMVVRNRSRLIAYTSWLSESTEFSAFLDITDSISDNFVVSPNGDIYSVKRASTPYSSELWKHTKNLREYLPD